MPTSDSASLQRLLDRAALQDLSGQYMRGLDRRDAALLRSLFHGDATTHYGAFSGGPDEFVAYAMGALSTHEANQHLVGQINLTFSPDGATGEGEVYFHAFHRLARDGVRTDMVISGRYVDRYAFRDGRWGFTHRTEIVDWATTGPTVDAYMPARPHLVVGRPGPDDLSYRIREA